MASLLGAETRLTHIAQAALRWWLKELADMLPDRLVRWLTDAGARRLVVMASDNDGHLFLSEDRGRILAQRSVEIDERMPEKIDSFLKEQGLRRREVVLGLALPAEKFFSREIMLPREVGRSLDSVAFQDLLRSTPFREDDIYYDDQAEHSGAQITVRQSVIRRSLVHDAAQKVGIDAGAFAFIEADHSVPHERPAAIRMRRNIRRNRWLTSAFALLIASCLIGLAMGAVIQYRHQTAQLDALSAEIATARARAHEVRAALEARQKAERERGALSRLKHGSAKLLDVWEEVSDRLPDQSWVQEFKLAKRRDQPGYEIALSGFSSAAANLVEVLDKSALLTDVALAAPISIDPVEKQERFVLEAVTASESAKTRP